MTNKQKVRKDNLSIDRSIFGRMRRLNSALYLTLNSENGRHKIVNLYTNEIVGEIYASGYIGDYKYTKGMRPDFAVVYDPVETKDKIALYIFDGHGGCIFKYKGRISYLPSTHIVGNKSLIYLFLRLGDTRVTNIVVYDNLNLKVDILLNNIVKVNINKNSAEISYIDDNNELRYYNI